MGCKNKKKNEIEEKPRLESDYYDTSDLAVPMITL